MNTNKHFLRRRILAFLTDWLCLALLMLPLGVVAHAFVRSMAVAGIFVLVGFGLLALFLLRDRLFEGRGIGKRLFGLRLIDPSTGGIPTLRQSVINGLCLCLGPFDAIFLLSTGKSIGERCACVQVVDAAEAADHQPAKPKDAPAGRSSRRILVICLCLAMVLFLAVVWFAGSKSLEAIKETESYQLAFQHLTDTLTQEGESLPQIILNSRSYRASGHCEEVGTVPTERYTFLVGLESYTVVCHAQGESWYVCTVCTDEP